jgi:hypothetical protein
MLEFVFSPTELKILDDTLPEFKRKEKLDNEEAEEEEVIKILSGLLKNYFWACPKWIFNWSP